MAKRAGVSFKTVSRVINNEAHVRAATRERVMAAIDELGYTPNQAARQLAGTRSFLISFLARDIMNSYYSGLVIAAAAACRHHGYHLVAETLGRDEAGEAVISRMIETVRPDGIILPLPLCNDREMLAVIEANRTPLVRIGGFGGGYGEIVSVDEEPVSRQVVEHLVAQGHNRIGFIGLLDGGAPAAARFAGYRNALADAGIPFDPGLVAKGDFSFASGVLRGEAMLRDHHPTAIFAANDGMALGVMAAATRLGLKLPHDLAVAGFDDSPASRMVFPALTTVRQPIEQLAGLAVAMLVDQPSDRLAFPFEFMPRGSTTGSLDLDLSLLDG